jgi:hypothetical protein
MEPPHDPTIGFTVWPVMMIVEGPSSLLGIGISMIYNDHRIPRDNWHINHNERSRAHFAETLRKGGNAHKRVGIGIKDKITASMIEARMQAFRLKCTIFRGETKPSV